MATQTRAPTSDVTATGTWTGSSGTRYTAVDDYPDTSADSLTHGTTAGVIEFGFSAFSVPSGATVNSVSVRYYSNKTAAQGNTFGARITVGGTGYNSATDNQVNGTPTQYTKTWTTNPATSAAWTVDQVNGTAGSNNLEAFGLNSGSDANPTIVLWSVEVVVDYTPAPVVGDVTESADASEVQAAVLVAAAEQAEAATVAELTDATIFTAGYHLYVVTYPSALGTTITGPQIVAGDGPDDNPATWADNIVPTTGTNDWPYDSSGLSGSTLYRDAMVGFDGSSYTTVSVTDPWETDVESVVHNAAVTEPADAADVAAAVATFAATASEAGAGADLPAGIMVASVSATEPAAAADVIAGALVTLVTVTEEAAAVDVADFGAAVLEVVAVEAVAAADLLDAVATLVVARVESVAAADELVVAMVATMAATEAAAGTDVPGYEGGAQAADVTEAVAAADLPAGANTTAAARVESAAAVDVVNFGAASYSVAATEAVTVADAVAAALQALAAALEAAPGADVPTVVLQAGAAAVEPAAAVEVAAAAQQALALLLEAAAGSDAPNFEAGGVQAASVVEAAAGTDLLVVAFIRGFVAITAAPRVRLAGAGARPAALATGARPAVTTGSRPANRPGRGR